MIRRPPRSTLFPTRRSSDLMGITGGLKIAHLGEALGVDVEVHACTSTSTPSASPRCAIFSPPVIPMRSEERRVGKSVDLGGRRIIKKKKNEKQVGNISTVRN